MTGEALDLHEQVQDEATRHVLELVRGGEDIEGQLLALASIGGTRLEPTPEQAERYATSRVALSAEDIQARQDFIKPLMQEVGMEVHDHPFGLIGVTAGEDSSLAPLVRLSHTDTVPNGDMYDGTLGVIGELEVARAMREAGARPRRTIIDIALTGEESAAFGFATFGSQAMFHGLTDKDLNSLNAQGVSIRDMLTPDEIETVQQPIFGPDRMFSTPHAVVELHVEQGSTLEAQGVDLGIVEAIAAPVRHIVEIGGTTLRAQASDHEVAKYLQLTVRGQADHSGTTPMGTRTRADGLVETAEYLRPLISTQLGKERERITIGEIAVEDGAINKIPGITTTLLRLNGRSSAEIDRVLDVLKARLADQNKKYDGPDTRFGAQPLSLEEIKQPEAVFFGQQEMLRRQAVALGLVSLVNKTAASHAHENVVGTVGTYTTTDEGVIKLGLDIRGNERRSRNVVVARIKAQSARYTAVLASTMLGEPLSGSGDPVELDKGLVSIAKSVVEDFGIGSSDIMFSAAGHDAQNAARVGIPAVMLFCQSGHEGIAHHPDAYTNPENLRKGVGALAALSMRLAA
jgi:acetylornithine deacetylase/succinyl-diaminopimelate desuccinylase-like protein